jgi:hypothetical protein
MGQPSSTTASDEAAAAERSVLMGSAVDSGAAHRRAWWTLRAAALVNGPAELLDFLIPLWAGPVLGASGIQVGLLVGTELAVSVAARPASGQLLASWGIWGVGFGRCWWRSRRR